MKKTLWTALLGLMLAFMLCVPAMAQTTGIEVDGKTYTFMGGEGTYKADGKTFIIGTESVTIQEAGKPDRTLNLVHAPDTNVAQDVQRVFVQQGTESVATSVEEPIAEYVQSSSVTEETYETCIAGTATEYAQSSYVIEDVSNANAVNPERFKPYAEFGLRYDAASNTLYYQGRRVRIFEDSYPLEDQAYAALEHVDDQGTVDVKTTRDLSLKVYNADGSYDPSGTLTGLYVLPDAEFAARDLRDWTEPKRLSTAVEGVEMTPAEKEALYAPYAAFGLDYNAKADTLTYQGKRVRNFMDIKQSNGEALNSGHFKGVMTCIGGEDGEIDVETIRDFTKPDADGNGTLIGISVEQVR